MICTWSNCQADCENLGRHIYCHHLEKIPTSYKYFYCHWENCDCQQVFKYKSHLVLHLRDHLSGKIKSKERPLNQNTSTAAKKIGTDNQETMQLIPALPGIDDDANYVVVGEYGSKVRCPIQNCKQVLKTS